jgi:hypothetical protein
MKVTLNPAFKLVFISVFVLTVVFAAAAVALTMKYSTPSTSQATSIDTLWTMAKVGFGAIAGLLGGKLTP